MSTTSQQAPDGFSCYSVNLGNKIYETELNTLCPFDIYPLPVAASKPKSTEKNV